MNVSIHDSPLTLELYGFSAVAKNKDYAGAAFPLMNRMWKIIKSNDLKNKGLNIWVYEPDESVFAGVQLEEAPQASLGLERKIVTLDRYAYHKHIGSYSVLKQVGQSMTAELKNRGFEAKLPYVEIYGHWTNDESKLETELLMSLK